MDRSLEKSGRGRGFLVRQDLGEGDAGVVIDRDMNVFPTGTMDAAATRAGDTTADSVEASDFLDVEMEQIAWEGMLITQDRRRRFQITDTTEVEPAQNTAHGGATESRGERYANAGPTLNVGGGRLRREAPGQDGNGEGNAWGARNDRGDRCGLRADSGAPTWRRSWSS